MNLDLRKCPFCQEKQLSFSAESHTPLLILDSKFAIPFSSSHVTYFDGGLTVYCNACGSEGDVENNSKFKKILNSEVFDQYFEPEPAKLCAVRVFLLKEYGNESLFEAKCWDEFFDILKYILPEEDSWSVESVNEHRPYFYIVWNEFLLSKEV